MKYKEEKQIRCGDWIDKGLRKRKRMYKRPVTFVVQVDRRWFLQRCKMQGRNKFLDKKRINPTFKIVQLKLTELVIEYLPCVTWGY